MEVCPKCGSSNIQVEAWIDPNTEDVRGFPDPTCDNQVWCDACQEHSDSTDCTEEKTETTAKGLRRLLETMTNYLYEAHADDNGMLASSHEGDAPHVGYWPEGCTYCKAIMEATIMLRGKDQWDFVVAGRKEELK